jgi:hypothetical protein
MTTVPGAIAMRLSEDEFLTAAPPAGLGFLIFQRWLVKTGPGSTPEAFDETRGGRLKRAIVVRDASEQDEPARQPSTLKRLFVAPTTHIFAEAHENGKQAANDAYRRIESLLLGWDLVLSPNERVGFVASSRLTLDESEQFPGNIVIVASWRMTGTRRLVSA